jgi:hypothetical protein
MTSCRADLKSARDEQAVHADQASRCAQTAEQAQAQALAATRTAEAAATKSDEATAKATALADAAPKQGFRSGNSRLLARATAAATIPAIRWGATSTCRSRSRCSTRPARPRRRA